MFKHKKFLILFGLLVLAGGLGIPVAHAAEAETVLGAAGLNSSGFMTQILAALNTVAWIAFDLLDTLLDPAFIFNSFDRDSEIIQTLRKVWVLSRNIVNIAFAVGLIFAAIFTVMKADTSLVKENRGRFVLSVVLVNFSWLFPLMIIDISNIMTSVVYGIPSSIAAEGKCTLPPEKEGEKEGKPCKTVSSVVYFPDQEAAAGVIPGDTCPNPKSIAQAKTCSPAFDCTLKIICVQLKEWGTIPEDKQYKKVLHGLVFNYARLGDLSRMPAAAPGGAGEANISQWILFTIRILLTILIHIALAFPLLALVLAYLIRIPVLWMTTAFMPFFFIGFVLEIAKVPGAESTKSILSEFMKAAFLPVITGIPLVIGFIMMNALASVGWKSFDTQIARGAPLTGGIATFFDVIWMSMALGVMWVGTFKALSEHGGIAGQFGGMFKNLGESIGKVAGGAALSIPAVPGTGGRMNFLQAAQHLTNPRGTANAILAGGRPFENLRRMGAGNLPTSLHSDDEMKKIKTSTTNFKADVKTSVQNTINGANAAVDVPKLIGELQKELRDAGSLNATVTQENLLQHLDELKRGGALTDAEFSAADRAALAAKLAPPPAAPPAGGPPAP